ncbi:MAG TPA: M2 family metallopeptidase [Vicinamibacterales bacterium]|nr:M2 family metallopeptidase [Vicinamibacterales bacterium]
MRITRFGSALLTSVFLAVLMASASPHAQSPSPRPSGSPQTAPQFLESANADMLRLSNAANRAGWVQATFITPDTEIMAAEANGALINAVTRFATEAAKFRDAQVSPSERRQLDLLRTSLTMAAPPDASESEELTRLVASMEGAYGRGKYCAEGVTGDDCLDVEEITEILAKDRDPKRLLEVWAGWHTISIPMRKDYQRFVELSNKGAKALGFADTGAMWRSKYDMPPEAFAKELDRLWQQLQPLYVSLHAYVRTRLREKYGAVVPEKGPIPAHLLGNLWQQDWSNVYDLVAPPGAAPSFSLTDRLEAKKVDALEMVRIGERFFTSLGFAPLPKTFWERSLFVKPRDREVVCHASAWDIDNVEDLRIKMCIDVNAEDFTTIHHELGHNFYQRAYNKQPMLFRDSANDGFHEAVGDTLALSVTPEYLVRIGLLDKAPDASGDIPLLLRSALERLAFLPFGLMVDQWRWQVFDGTISPANYNRAWWDLKLKYQGVAPSTPRDEEFFDPAAKYHVPGNTPYTRYFLAGILQFQFHRALANAAGCTGPLHRCSIYGSKEAGQRLNAMLEMGASRPWPEALKALTGQSQMDASAMAAYFEPLKRWLDQQNAGKPVGW